jgi:c(7)-type cytochrome triheme protein
LAPGSERAGRGPRLYEPKAVLGVVGLWLLAAASHGQQQPVPYSHKAHLALGLKCDSCHTNADPGEFMGLPAESFCMSCHQAIKVDSPHIEKVAAAARDKKPIPWVRVYRLAAYVYFSHRVHTAAGATCDSCHGPVRERDVITKEVVHNMRSCMACHAATKARNDCAACHEER